MENNSPSEVALEKRLKRREAQRKKKMKVSGKNVFQLRDAITKKK